MVKMDERKIKRYKESILKLFKVNKSEKLNLAANGIKSLLHIDFQKGLITQEELDILETFLQSLLEEYKIHFCQEEKQKEQLALQNQLKNEQALNEKIEQNLQEFHNRLRVKQNEKATKVIQYKDILGKNKTNRGTNKGMEL